MISIAPTPLNDIEVPTRSVLVNPLSDFRREYVEGFRTIRTCIQRREVIVGRFVVVAPKIPLRRG